MRLILDLGKYLEKVEKQAEINVYIQSRGFAALNSGRLAKCPQA